MGVVHAVAKIVAPQNHFEGAMCRDTIWSHGLKNSPRDDWDL